MQAVSAEALPLLQDDDPGSGIHAGGGRVPPARKTGGAGAGCRGHRGFDPAGRL